MTAANAIVSTEARLADGSVVAYRDADPLHIKQDRFRHILAGTPLHFTVTLEDGSVFGVDLVDGSLEAGPERLTPNPQTTPLRLIYYKRMHAENFGNAVMEFFVVGWQTTTQDGRNVKVGLKVFPDESRYEVTESI